MAHGIQELLGPMRAAIDRYGMIADGDSVAVGVSGGKDSVALLTALARLRRFYPHPFSLTAITIDPCFGGRETDYSAVAALCERLEVPYLCRRTTLWQAVEAAAQAEKPCSLCAKMRRGVLHKTAVEAGCRVIALGHHQDDAAATFWMNLTAGGTLGCFSPKTELDRRGITLIRPLLFLPEKTIAAAVQAEGLPVIRSRCPVDGCTNRAAAEEVLRELSRTYGDMPDKILRALQKAGLNGW